MNGRRADPRGRRVGTPWFAAGISLAVVATTLLVLSEDARWLRLGILAALWAALLGAFLATKYRRQAETAQESVRDAQSVYELELEREIAARREYELEAEAEIRRKVEAESRDELAALRAELSALRDSLQQLFGGEVLYERVALTAQSTRMRSLADDGKYLPAQPVVKPVRISGSASRPMPVDPVDARTELIARVLETEAPVHQQPRREPPRPPHREPMRHTGSEPLRTEPSSSGADLPKREPTGAPLFSAAPFSTRSEHDDFAKGFDMNWGSSCANGRDEESPGEPNNTLPDEVRQIQSEQRPGGRRRKQESPAGPEYTGGRRRLPEGEPPWNAFEPVAGARAGKHAGGSHADQAESAGSHSAGRSVADLLASLGSDNVPRRRRRRD